MGRLGIAFSWSRFFGEVYGQDIDACAIQARAIVRGELTEVFRTYSLPARITSDNGPPLEYPRESWQVSELALWLIRLGITVSFIRPYHPQTNGKDGRLHRLLNGEVLNRKSFTDLVQGQAASDGWSKIYRHQRPHHSLGMATPASRPT